MTLAVAEPFIPTRETLADLEGAHAAAVAQLAAAWAAYAAAPGPDTSTAGHMANLRERHLFAAWLQARSRHARRPLEVADVDDANPEALPRDENGRFLPRDKQPAEVSS